MKTKLSRISKRTFSSLLSLIIVLSTFIIFTSITASAETIVLRYMKNMPSNYWDGDASVTLTQSSSNSNRYYGTATWAANSSYGCFITRNSGSDIYKASSSASSDSVIQLYKYTNNNANRVTFSTGSATKYSVTFDTSNSHLIISPQESSSVTMYYDVAAGHDNNWTLDKSVTMSHSSSNSGDYIGYAYLTGGYKYYMYIMVGNNYYKAASSLSVGGNASLYAYGSNNNDKVNFQPSTGGYYKFTWSHREKIVYLEKVALPYSSKTFKIGDDITNKYDSNASTMSGSGSTRTFTYYLKKDDTDVYFRFYNSTDSAIFGSETNNQIVSTSYSASTRTNYGVANNFYIDNSAALSDSSKYYAVVVSLGLTEQSNSGSVKYTATAKDNMTATLSSNMASFNRDTQSSQSITFTAGTSNLFGSGAKYEYYRSSDGGSTYTLVQTNSVSSTSNTYSWKPGSSIDTGTYKVKVKITDTTVNTATNARTARSIESDPVDIVVTRGQTYNTTRNYQIGTNSATGAETIQISDQGTTLTFDTYKMSGNVRYKLTNVTATGNVELDAGSFNAATGQATFTASGTGGTITAVYGSEADYNIYFFKKPSGWDNANAYLYGSNDLKNAAWPGIAMSQTDAVAVTDMDFLGSRTVQNGASQDIYYYYKTYNSNYTHIIFNNGNGSYQTRDIPLASIQTDTASGQTYEKDEMYYVPSANVTNGSKESGKWSRVPDHYYNVTVSAADASPSYIGSGVTGTVTGVKSGDTNGIVKVSKDNGVNVTITPPDGYKIDTDTPWNVTGSATVTKVSLSESSMTYTVKATGTGASISPNYIEIGRTISVVKRYYRTGDTSPYTTTNGTSITDVGIKSSKSTGVATNPDGDYTFESWEAADSNLVLASGSNTGNPSALTVTAKANTTLYINYRETLYTVTTQNDGHGTVRRSGSNTNITSTSIGNVTEVTLQAIPADGYEFKEWVVVSGGSAVTIGSPTSASTTFRTSAAATVKATFKAVTLTIRASVKSGYASGNSVTTSLVDNDGDGEATIGDDIKLTVTLADGYEVDSIAGISPNTYLPSPSQSGTTYTYRIDTTLINQRVFDAEVTLKAKTPTISSGSGTANQVQIRNNSTSEFPYASYANGATVPHYYMQPLDFKVRTDSFSSLTFSNGSTSSSVAKGAQADDYTYQLAHNSTAKPTTANGTATYTFTVTATNAPTGVTAATYSRSFTISVTYNAPQKEYFKLKTLYDNTLPENSSTVATYYEDSAPLTAYTAARTAAASYLENSMPDYDATDTTAVAAAYNAYLDKVKDMQAKAKTTTVYVLSQYPRNATNFVSIENTTNGTTADYDHYKQYHYYLDAIGSSTVKSGDKPDIHLMNYEGQVTYSGTKYLYSFTYAGHTKVRLYCSAEKGSGVSNQRMLSGNITGITTSGKKYIDINSTSYSGSSTAVSTVPSVRDWVDLNTYRWDSTNSVRTTKKCLVEYSTTATYTATQVRDLLGLRNEGSLNTSPGVSFTGETVKIATEPNGTTMKTLSSSTTWTPNKHGRFKVEYTIQYNGGVAQSGATASFTKTTNFYIYVRYDEVTVYVDMNGNVGSPMLNFDYKANSDGTPNASGSSTAILPYEMSLVTGSENVYAYKVDLKKLNSDYNLSYASGLKIDRIKVDNTDYDNSDSGYLIDTDAYASGAIWFKANSTNMTEFNKISLTSVTTTFRAVNSDGNNLEDAISKVEGTGIITDEDGVFENTYAGYDDSADSTLKYVFGYNLRASAKKEFKVGDTTYFFDHWEKIKVNDDIFNATTGAVNDLSPTETSYSAKADLNLNSAPNYEQGDGDYTYLAVYGNAGSTNKLRVEINYNFLDYDTSDGNYVYDGTIDSTTDKILKTTDATVTETVFVDGGSTSSYNTKDDVKALVKANVPVIGSNYFNYSFEDTTANTNITKVTEDSSTNKVTVEVSLKETAREYSVLVDGNEVGTGNFQQTVSYTVPSNKYLYAKEGSNEIVLAAAGTTYEVRCVPTMTESGTESNKVKLFLGNGSKTVDKTSVVYNGFNESYYNGTTQAVHHNFYIIDYFNKTTNSSLEFVGGGVMYATVDSSGNYRQNAAGTNLADNASRVAFVTSSLKGNYTDDMPAQTINNTGFRYLSATGNVGKDKLRYSDALKGYQYTFTGNNNISDSYAGQKLRVYSFFVYTNGSTYTVVVSENYAEVERNHYDSSASVSTE